MPRTLSLAFLALTLLAAAPGQDDATKKAIAEEWKRRNGKWEPVATVIDGKEMPAAKDRKFVLTYQDGQYKDFLDDKVVGEGESRIDPTKDPKTLDIIPKGADPKTQTLHAIYELKGDELKVCMALPAGKARPTKFEAPAGSGQVLMTFKRVKA
jgi:uncharacterized protein (TIGR03067 family)